MLLLGMSGAARAQSEGTEFELALPKSDPTKERLRMTLPEGRVLVQAFIEASLSTDLAFKPVSLSPDVWYGLTDDISLGLAHSAAGSGGLYGGVGTSLCLTGADNGCGDVYRNVSLLGRYSLLDAGVGLAAQGGLVIGALDPLTLSLQLGVAGRWEMAPIAVVFQPSIQIGLTEREGDAVAGTAGNTEVITLPVAAMYDVMPELAVGLQTGVSLLLEDIGNTWVVPLSLGGRYAVTPAIWAELVFSLPAVVQGADTETGAFDTRTLTLGGGTVF
ncbi:MAG TPA: hypothetical protein VNM90_23705 [Haliangium sp.]|nr:hypothetical protein [Haliangium sp.]